MWLILLVLGILLAGAGAAAIGFSIPINALSLGSTLILAGTTALAGGFVLIGLSLVAGELARIGSALRAQPGARATRAEAPAAAAGTVEPTPAREPMVEPPPPPPRDVRPPEPRPTPAPAPAPTLEVSASAIERLRSSIPRPDKGVPLPEEVPLSPNGQQQHVEPPVPRPVGAAAVEAREPRLDFLFRSRQPARPAPQPEQFDALWPRRPVHETRPEPASAQRVEPRMAEAPAAAAPEPADEPAPAADAHQDQAPAATSSAETVRRSVAILKSGVVDGMAYTLYADGSIEAQLPQGTVRFGSIAELREHIESNS
jgi:hypothetical protein